MRITTRSLLATALVLGMSACSGAQADRTGSSTLTLRVAGIDGEDAFDADPGAKAFVTALREGSGGRVRVEMTHSYGNGETQAEADLVKAVAAGEVDLAWPAARAFAPAGIAGLEVLEAPLTITSDEAAVALAKDPVADQLLDRLDAAGLEGIALVPGDLRRPFSAGEPLVGPEDWEGTRFRSFNSTTQSETITALGGVPVNVGIPWADEVTAGRLDGVDLSLRSVPSPHVPTLTANVALWPKIGVVIMASDRYEGLTAEQRGWLDAAATKALAAVEAGRVDASVEVQRLCDAGTRVVAAGEKDLAALEQAVRPVLDRLAADSAMARVAAIGDTHPATGPSVPPSCGAARTTAPTSVPSTVPPIADGVYRATVTADDVEAAGGDRRGIHPVGVWTLTIEEGTYLLKCDRVDGPETQCGGSPGGVVEAGDVRGDDDEVHLTMVPATLAELTGCALPPSTTLPGHCGPAETTAMTWTADGDAISFGAFRDKPATDNWLLEPYDRIS